LRIRDDDRPATVKRRLAIDRLAARPLLRYYERRQALHRVNGAGSVDQVLVRLIELFRRNGWVAADD